MGLGGAEAETYAKTVIAADFDRPGDEDVLEKVLADLTDKGVEMTAQLLRKEMDRLYAVAAEQITS